MYIAHQSGIKSVAATLRADQRPCEPISQLSARARERETEIGSQDSWPLACLTGISCDYKREAGGFNTAALLRNAKIQHFLFQKNGFRAVSSAGNLFKIIFRGSAE